MVNKTRDEEWAVDLFRPLLRELKLQESSKSYVLVKVSDYRHLVIKGMGRCLIVLKRRPLSKQNLPNRGYFVFIHREKENLYILYIVIDSDLYQDDSLDLRIARKAVGIHEFCHCVATMLSLAEVACGSPIFEKLRKRLCEKLHKTSLNDLTTLMTAFNSLETSSDDSLRPFPDSHFRLGFEDFPGDYAELYINFLLSYSLIKEMMSEEKLKALRMSLDNQEELLKFLISFIEDVSEKKAINKIFVIRRLKTLLPRLLQEAD